MASYKAEVRTDWTQQEAFDYLADFSTVSDWDPGIPRAECVEGTPREVGSKYEVDFEVVSKTFTLTYETIEIEAPNKIVLRSNERAITSLDTLTFRPAGGQTLVIYEAELTLSGPLKLADPALQMGFNKAGADAEEGLQKRLSQPPPSDAGETNKSKSP